MNSSRLILALAGLLTSSSVAHAITQVTPFVFANGSTFIACIATNGEKKAMTIDNTGHAEDGTLLSVRSDTCVLGDVPPGGTCYVLFNEDQDVSCKFDGPGKMRAYAEIMEWAGGRLVGTIPATK
jgi:hypothetical protein